MTRNFPHSHHSRHRFLHFLAAGALTAGGLAGIRDARAMKAAPGVNKMTEEFRINGAEGEIGALVGRSPAFDMDVYGH